MLHDMEDVNNKKTENKSVRKILNNIDILSLFNIFLTTVLVP